MEKIYCVILFYILVLFCFAYKGDGCTPPPESCLLLPSTSDPIVNKTVSDINRSVQITPNSTVVTGDNVEFKIVIDRCDIDASLSPIIDAYVNGCFETKLCTSQNTPEQFSSICTFKNLSSTREVQFFIRIVIPDIGLLSVCQPSSFVAVEDVPSNVAINKVVINLCEGVSFIFGPVSYDAHLVCNVYTIDDRSPVLLYSNSLCDNSTVIPPEVFRNHTGQYKVTAYAMKTVAKGKESEMTFSFSNEGLNFSIVEASVDLMEGNSVATIIVKINESCPLKIPNYFFITSNCSNHKQQELILNNFLGHHSVYYHKLQSQNKNCVLFIEDSGGNKKNYSANLSSFHTQAFVLQTVSNRIVAVCHFLPHSSVDGCQLNITSDTMDEPFIQNITRDGHSSLATDVIAVGWNPGQYYFLVTDWINGSTNSSEIAFQTTLIVHSVTSSSVATAANTSTSITPELEMPSQTSGHCEGGFAVLGTLLFVAVVVIVVQVVFIVILCYRDWKKRKVYSVTNRDSVCFRKASGNGKDTQDEIGFDSGVSEAVANGHHQGDNELKPPSTDVTDDESSIQSSIQSKISSFSGQVSNGTKDSANPSLELSFPVESGNQHTPPTGNDKVPVASAPAVATDNTATSVFIPTVRPESESHKGFGSQIVQITSYAKVSTSEEYSTPSAIGEFTMEPSKNKYIPPDKNAASEVAKNSSMISAPSDASESTPFIKPTSGTS